MTNVNYEVILTDNNTEETATLGFPNVSIETMELTVKSWIEDPKETFSVRLTKFELVETP